MKIAFIGSGYVGLVSGVMMSHLGHEVTCIDTDLAKITSLQQLKSPIFEPGLDQYLEKYGNSNRLEFLHGYNRKTYYDAIFLTVGTPSKLDGSADLGYIFDSVDQLLSNEMLSPASVLVIKSTVPPGTCKKVANYIKDKGCTAEVVSNPEFLREGSAIEDFLNPDRIVIGSDSEEALKVMQTLYKPLTDKGVKLVQTDTNSSELIKYAANSFLANKIAFINEMADLCEVIGANVEDLSIGIGLDRRIGKDFLKAGPGFGGSCFPKDILALQHLTNDVGCDSLILDAVIAANSQRTDKMVAKISKIFGGNLKGKTIAIFGLAYKAGTDDIRSSPAIKLIESLKKLGTRVKAYDPRAMVNSPKYFKDLSCANTAFEAAENSDCVLLLTEWQEFKEIDFEALKSILKSPIIIDLRNFLDGNLLTELGYKYYSIGKNEF